MKTPKNIEHTKETAFDVLDDIKKVNVSPFFKDKTMQRLFAEKEEIAPASIGWFTPKLQFATLICVLVINVFGILQLTNSTYNENVAEFASAYELSQDAKPSLFN
ncbi:hypothetical protein H2O64_07550 [Kordia sp. YSTF-M3]|uniref:Uncharacterized protein n=1 Tax=Kordia aestuariivivens TaxID=2759037 RepID=A0ABR7Q7W0_9FLAO|nr:hypothetical protein [Kordia aestuariivivens]MBC8754523.1 hypothetical protein [Kordia aestuariivivens]